MGLSLPGWPGGDPGALDRAAKAWDSLADAIESAVEDADTTVQASFADLEGTTKDSFLEIWNNYAAGQRNAVEGARSVAESLRSIGEKIDEAHKKYEHIMEGLGAAAAVGIVVGIFTFGLGTAAEETAAFAAATAAITSLLETLGLTIAEEAVADVLGSILVESAIGAEFSVFMQEGESIGAGKGLTMVDWTDVGTSAATGGAFGGLMKGVEAAAYVKAALGGAVMAGGTVASSELNGDGLPSVPEVLVSAILGSVAGKIDAALDAGETRLAAQAEEKNLAVDFAALYKNDPDSLIAIKNDPYQADDIRYLAYQYHQLFESDPDILQHVPALADLLKDHPQAIAHAVRINTQLMDVAAHQGLPPSVVRSIWESLAPHSASVNATYDGVSDYVKDWMKAHHEVVEELEKETAEAAR